ncbi:MAG: alkyl sulfatase dimerization domain-containing protein, partial [Kofleriaceae bacterium]
PFAVVRDTFVQRLYRERAGYWSGDGAGMDEFTAGEWASVLDSLAGNSADRLEQVVADLVSRGDASLALRIADLGLRAHPTSASLQARRHAALAMLQARYQQVNPFRFIIYSGWSGRDVAPLTSSAPR